MLPFFFSIALAFGTPLIDVQITKDLQPQWKILLERNFIDYDGRATKTIHFSVELDRPSGQILVLQSQQEFYLFLNSSLFAKSNHFELSADSLKKKFGKNVFVSIHQTQGIKHLTTNWISRRALNPLENPVRPNRSFSNFVLLAVMLLIIFFTSLLRNNPQLTLDYFNVIKLFAFKRRDDSQFVLRITSSVNLLFYFFCSLFTSLALIVAVHFSENISLFFQTNYANVGSYFLLWCLLSLIVVALLMFKLGLAAVVSTLFGWRDTAGFQFFNFVRLLVISLVFIGVISLFGFSLTIDVNYYLLLKVFCALLLIGAVLMYFKLLNRQTTGAFHLFSYLCATEILPLVILIKVFLF